MPARAAHERTVERLRLRQAPLAAAAVWFALGIGAERLQASRDVYAPLPLLLAAIVLLVGLAATAFWRAQRVAWLPVAGVWFALGLASLLWRPAPAQPQALLEFADNLSRAVRGRVTRVQQAPPHPPNTAADQDKVAPWEEAEDTSQFGGRHSALYTVDLALEQVEEVTPDVSRMVPAQGGVRVSVFGEAAAGPVLHCGDELRTTLRMKPPGRYRDPRRDVLR